MATSIEPLPSEFSWASGAASVADAKGITARVRCGSATATGSHSARLDTPKRHASRCHKVLRDQKIGPPFFEIARKMNKLTKPEIKRPKTEKRSRQV
jgi:hypothetical protein